MVSKFTNCQIKSQLLQLKIPGIIIFAAFSKKHLEYVTANEKVGDPKDIVNLFSIEEIKADFFGLGDIGVICPTN